MDIENRKIWQQAAGDKDRNYVDICLNWDVILNGPATKGSFADHVASYEFLGRKYTDLGRFCDTMSDGDLVVLRLGTNQIYAVGEIVGGYQFHEEFNDIDGWDIGHVRRVRWLWRSPPLEPQEFPTYTLKQGDTTQESTSEEVKNWMRQLEIQEHRYNRDLKDLPSESTDNKTNIEQISDHLFNQGIASSSINSLLDEIGELIRIANWYWNQEEYPSESETINYLAVPLLRVLGWTPQRMAIEWGRIDLALFSKLPRDNENLSVVIEAKRMNQSCFSAFEQAKSYAEIVTDCKTVVVTDGIRYGVYIKNDENEYSLYSYLNLTRLQKTYPLYECRGAQDTLLALTPEWQLGN